MYLTQSNVIRGLTKQEYSVLRELCRYSKNLYNVALYNIRQHYFAEKAFLRYETNYHACKENENYKLLQAGISQQILKVVDRSFKSFFSLVKKAKNGEYRFQDIRMPKYLDKNALFPLILSTNAINIKGDKIILPCSKTFKHKISIPFPKRLEGFNIKEVRILPISNGRHFKIQYVYEVAQENKNLNTENALGIDIGLENLATCVSSKDGTAFIMDGRKLKSINHYWNKRMARLQSIADQSKQPKRTNQMNQLTDKRNNRCNDYIKKAARHIVNYCIENDIGTIVVGYNKDFKRGINIGKKNNQQFTQISFGALRDQLKNLCDRYGMDYIEQEESYTSKASSLDGDTMPVFNPHKDEKYVFSGKRIKRGLYRSSKGTIINADVNGAFNILRKSKRNLLEPCIGLLASPKRFLIS